MIQFFWVRVRFKLEEKKEIRACIFTSGALQQGRTRHHCLKLFLTHTKCVPTHALIHIVPTDPDLWLTQMKILCKFWNAFFNCSSFFIAHSEPAILSSNTLLSPAESHWRAGCIHFLFYLKSAASSTTVLSTFVTRFFHSAKQLFMGILTGVIWY